MALSSMYWPVLDCCDVEPQPSAETINAMMKNPEKRLSMVIAVSCKSMRNGKPLLGRLALLLPRRPFGHLLRALALARPQVELLVDHLAQAPLDVAGELLPAAFGGVRVHWNVALRYASSPVTSVRQRTRRSPSASLGASRLLCCAALLASL